MSKFEKGDFNIWTDPYIQKGLLYTQLNDSIAGGGHSKEQNNKILEWLYSYLENKHLKILDLGSGNGYLANKLASLGHKVIGIDINKIAINYSKNHIPQGTDITFLKRNYKQRFPSKNFDTIFFMNDYSSLIPQEKDLLMRKINRSLKIGGEFIFDVFGFGLNEINKEKKDWMFSEPYSFFGKKENLVLHELSYLTKENAWKEKYIIINKHCRIRKSVIYAFLYTKKTIKDYISHFGFELIDFNTDLAQYDLVGKNIKDFAYFIRIKKIKDI